MSAAFPLRGFPPFIFGMTRAEVRAAAGEPDVIERIESDFAGAAEKWDYASRQVQITFGEDEQWKLEAIDVLDSAVTLGGVSLIGASAADLPALAAKGGIADVRPSEDGGEFGTSHESDQHGLLFWEVDGVIVSFTLFPAYDETGDVVLWPDTH
jgi:hypothetical protein